MRDMAKMRERALKAMETFGVPAPINARYKFLEGTERIIKSPSVAEGLIRKDVLSSREKPYVVRKLTLNTVQTSADNVLGLTTRGHNKSLWFAKPGSTLMRYASGLEETISRFSPLFLVVRLPEDEEECRKVLEKAIVVYNGYCFFWHQVSYSCWPVYPIEYWEGQRLDEDEWRAIPELNPLAENGWLKKGALLYNTSMAGDVEEGWDSSSAGEIKQGAIPFICQNLGDIDGFAGFDVRAYKYAITSGASEILCEQREISAMKDMAQAVNRLSQADAPQTAYGELDTVCWYLGKFQTGEGFDHCDGLGFLTSEHFAHLASVRSAGKYRFTPESVRGLCAQMRPASMCKLLAVSVMSSSVAALMNTYSTDAVILVRDQITEEDINRVTRIIRDKDKTDSWYGKNLIICGDEKVAARLKEGDYRDVQFYTDLNGLKCSYDLKMHVDCSILEVTHSCHNIQKGANTSTQMLGSLFAVNASKTAKHLLDAIAAHVHGKVDSFFAAEGRKPHLDDFDRGGDMGQLLASILPVAARDFSFPLLKRLANKIAEGLTTRIGQLSVPVAGLYCKIIPDPAVHFGVHILEVHNGDTMDVIQPAAHKAGFMKGIAVKYPKCHIREFGKTDIHGTDWYIERVKACTELTPEQKAVCIDIAHVSGGAIMIPAYDAVMHMLAGLDYDGDAMILYLEQWIVDVLKDTKPLAVYIED